MLVKTITALAEKLFDECGKMQSPRCRDSDSMSVLEPRKPTPGDSGSDEKCYSVTLNCGFYRGLNKERVMWLPDACLGCASFTFLKKWAANLKMALPYLVFILQFQDELEAPWMGNCAL